MKQSKPRRLTEDQGIALVFLMCACTLSAVLGWALHMWLGRGCP